MSQIQSLTMPQVKNITMPCIDTTYHYVPETPKMRAPIPTSEKRTLSYHLKTLYLFTKSDFKTVIFPQSIFAIAGSLSAASLIAGGQLSLSSLALRFPLMLFWLWTNLLVENISNQRQEEAVLEDATNKPWRPLPSGRLSTNDARRWLIVSIPIAVGAGMVLGAFKPTVCLMVLIWMYNDLEGSSSDIWLRNALNAGGLMCFSWGALSVVAKAPVYESTATSACSWFTSLLSTSDDGELTTRAYVWMLVTGLVIMTTVHAQDMPDMEGDSARGRKTVPLLYGETWARGSLAVMVIFWSAVCPAFWPGSSWLAWILPCTIGGSVACLTLLKRGQPCDEVAWKLWCLWAASLYMLPLFSSATTSQ